MLAEALEACGALSLVTGTYLLAGAGAAFVLAGVLLILAGLAAAR